MSGRLEKRRHRHIHSSLLAYLCWLDCKLVFWVLCGCYSCGITCLCVSTCSWTRIVTGELRLPDRMIWWNLFIYNYYNDPQNGSDRWVCVYPNSTVAGLLSIWQQLTDMDMALDTIVPESLPWEHTDEGPEYVLTLNFLTGVSEAYLRHSTQWFCIPFEDIIDWKFYHCPHLERKAGFGYVARYLPCGIQA